ncbi:MAG: metallophosphoesterase [Candidatus Woesearchaeota archaeon]
MKIVILGDIHGKWDKANAIISHELEDNGVALSTGDFCNYDYKPWKNKKLVFVHGNHDNPSVLGELFRQPKDLIALRAGDVYTLPDNTRVLGFPGVYSPHFFNHGEEVSKFYTVKDVEKALQTDVPIDILLSHEAPLGVVQKNGADVGKEHITRLIEELKPRLAIFGHHHNFYESRVGQTEIIGMGYPHHGYAILDTESYSLDQIKGLQDGQNKPYKFSWER